MITLSDITLRVAGRVLVENASVAIPVGARVGFVGRNGAGKTTVLKLLLGELAPDQGRVELPRGARIGQVAQEAPATDEPILSIVLAADVERARLLVEAETATDAARIAEIHARLDDIGAHSAPARAARILAGLGFDAAAQARPAREFSGGWRMRVALAGMLFAEPDLLLLDEPTNYLDLEGTLWLEGHLAAYPHTLIIVSHDRDLLNGAADRILQLEHRRLTLWTGNYDAFADARAERLRLDQKAAKRQDAERARLQAFVDRFRAKATKATQAQSRLKRLAKMQAVEVLEAEHGHAITFPAPARLLASPIVAMEGASAGYGGRAVLSKLDLRIDDDDRIGLLGSNGNGKSTFAKLVSGRLDAMSGRLTRAGNLSVGYFAQHQLDELIPERSVLDHVRRLMPQAGEAQVRGKAAVFGFSGERVETKVSALSGGEKARLLMGIATFAGPNLLVLDEPTNHLDIDARESLVRAITEFPGAVILISHDRHLLDACADRLWLVKGGTVRPFAGDLEDYRKLVLADARGDGAERPAAAAATRQAEPAPRKAAATQARRRLQEVEAEIARQTQRLKGIDALLADPAIYAGDPAKAKTLANLRRETEAALAHAEEEWLALSEQLEDA
jgi:ATP-binding cassette subfamily F protein 3